MARLSGRCRLALEGYHRPRETAIDTPSDPLTPAPPPDPRWAAPDPDAPQPTAAPEREPVWPDPAVPQSAASGWVVPGAPPGGTRWGGWTPPPDERTITVGSVIGEAWATYRRALGPLLLIGTAIGLLTVLLSLPTSIYTIRMYESFINVFVDAVQARADHTGITDPILLQAQFQAIFTMPTGTAITFAFADGAAIVLGILGTCVLTAAAMAARAGRRVSLAFAVMAVGARRSALVLPAVLLGLGSTLVTLAIQLNATAIQDNDFYAAGDSPVLGTLLSVAGIVLAVAIFYLSVRWGLAIAAILAEGAGLRAGLRRSSELTRGHRLRLAAIFIIVGILQGLTISLPSLVIGVVAGLGIGSVSSGVVAFAIASAVGSALWAPFNPAVAAVAYGRLAEREAGSVGATGPASTTGQTGAPEAIPVV